MFQFSKEQINRLFPFYIVINSKMLIEDFGIGFSASTLIKKTSQFNSLLSFIKPLNAAPDFETIKLYCNQPVILELKNEKKLNLPGQLQYIPETGNILFTCCTILTSSPEQLTQTISVLDKPAPHQHISNVPEAYESKKSENKNTPELIDTINRQKKELERLSLIARETINAVIITDTEGKIEWINKAFEKMSGYLLHEVANTKPGSFLQGKETNPATVLYMAEQIEKRETFECEILNYSKSGEPYWVRISGQPLFDESGNISQFFALQENITERKKIEEQVRLSEKRYRDLFNFSQALICTHNLSGTIITVNPSTCRLLEYEASEMIGKKIQEFIPETDRLDFNKNYIGEFDNKDDVRGVFCAVSKSGKKNYLLYQNYKVKEPGIEPYIIGFSQDITERIKNEQGIRNGEEKYRSIIENMNLGMVELDKDSNIVFANQNLCRMSGYSMNELVDKKLYNVFSEGLSRYFIKQKMYIKDQGVSEVYEFVTKNKRGEPRWWLVSGAPILTHNNEFKGSLAICLDITEQKNLEQDLRLAKQQAEQSGLAKEIFLANMSHEIRTPMNAILGMGRQLERTILDGQQHFYLNVINTAASNLLVIINDILDFSKIDAGKLILEKVGFNIKETVNKSLQVILHKAEEKGLALTADIDPLLAPVLIGDPHRFNQVLINLLSNSVKFTERGNILIRCVMEKDHISLQNILVEVIDTGIGMSEEFQNTLFGKFMQENDKTGKELSGTGLGMSIVKDLVELMNGEIEVTSKKNEGTIIRIRLAFQKGTENDLLKKEEKKPVSNTLSNKRILLVEDNEMNRIVATTVLKQYGAIIDSAINGLEAIEALRHNHYNIVLMDMRMPVMNGLEATKIIREQISATIPIIALTANAVEGEEQKCIQAGMNDFLAKPFDEEELVQLLAKWLGIKNIYADSNNLKKITLPHEALYNLESLKSISRGNEEFITKMLDVFIKGLRLALEQFENGIENNDIEKIKATAHRIKPSLSSLSINSLNDEIIQLEKYDLQTFTQAQFNAMIKKTDRILKIVIAELEDIHRKDSINV